jgi:hypothetical protein
MPTFPGFRGGELIGKHRAPIPIVRFLARRSGLGRRSVRLPNVLAGAALLAAALIASGLAPVGRLIPRTVASAAGSADPAKLPWRDPLAAGSTPAVSGSLYMSSTRADRLDWFGCREGQRARANRLRDVLVLLDFGRPARRHGSEGAILFHGAGFRRVETIRDAVVAYGGGFLRCTEQGSPIGLNVAAGTSNWGPHVTYGHGATWARMVNEANQLVDQKRGGGRVTVLGANDIELAWNGPRVSKQWVHGYDSVAQWPYLDYGDAGGCPPYGRCLGRWTLEDVWWVAWGARSAWPLPEIYTNGGSQASQWYHLSLYSLSRHGRAISFAGVLSQLRACRQSKNDPCRGMRNSPLQAWTQLTSLLNRSHRTAQHLRWSTDIGYDR